MLLTMTAHLNEGIQESLNPNKKVVAEAIFYSVVLLLTLTHDTASRRTVEWNQIAPA